MRSLGVVALLGLALACTPTPTDPQPDASEVDAPGPSPTPAPTPEPELAAPAPVEPAEAAPPPLPEGVELTHGYVIQVASKKDLDEAKSLAAQLGAQLTDDFPKWLERQNSGLTEFARQPEAYVIRIGRLWRVVVGGLANVEVAEYVSPRVSEYVGEGALVRNLTKVCPGRELREPGVYACVEGISRPDLDRPDPAAEQADAPPNPADPPAIHHPLATQVLVVLADNKRDPSYRTLVWTRAAGGLPEAGLADASLVEERPGLWVSDGRALWELRIEAKEVEYGKCVCDGYEDHADSRLASGVVRKSFNRLVAQPSDGGPARELIAATDFATESIGQCLAKAGELERNWQLVAIAGPHLLYVDKVFDAGVCGLYQQWTIMNMKIASLTGHTELATLEAELPRAATDGLRRDAHAAMSDELVTDEIGIPYEERRPDALLLTAIYPSYRSGKRFELRVQYGVQSCHLCGSGEWTDGYYVGRADTPHVASSSLSPPEDVRALVEYAWREYAKLTPIGWSRQHAPWVEAR